MSSPRRSSTPPSKGDASDRTGRSSKGRGWAVAIALATVGFLGVVALTLVAAARGGHEMAPESASPPVTAVLPPEATDLLKADHVRHDFGDVAVSSAPVEAFFTLESLDRDPTQIVAAYTSCMCTTAILDFPDGNSEGPFGMPGHDLPVRLDRPLGAEETLTVSVHFDPGAHGPEAIGAVERTVTVHAANGSSVTLVLSANVVAG